MAAGGMTQHKVHHKGVDFLVSRNRLGHLELVVFKGKDRRGVVLPNYRFGLLREILDTICFQLDNPRKYQEIARKTRRKKIARGTNDMIRRLNGKG